MKDVRKGRHFPHSTAMDARRQALLQRKPPSAVEFLPVGFGKVWQQHLRGREGLIA
jgi:2-hydroxychromene-2-carboxylate isomerase